MTTISEKLLAAGKSGDFETAQKLVDSCQHAIHYNDNRLLQWAARRGLAKFVSFLLKNGAKIHANHDNALKCAAENGHSETVEILIAAGARDDQSDYEMSSLELAKKNGHEKVVNLLLKNSAK